MQQINFAEPVTPIRTPLQRDLYQKADMSGRDIRLAVIFTQLLNVSASTERCPEGGH